MCNEQNDDIEREIRLEERKSASGERHARVITMGLERRLKKH